MNVTARHLFVPIVACLWTLQSVAADGPVKVEYLKPETFIDVKVQNFKTPPDQNKHLINFKSWLETEAVKHLQPGQSLLISISNIDLAGDYPPGASAAASNIRVLQDLYPPAMKLSFVLKAADGRVINSGDRQLRDMGFLMHNPASTQADDLEYDKAMVKRWLRKEFPTDM